MTRPTPGQAHPASNPAARPAPVDFGRTAADYDRYRPGFPASFYERLLTEGWVRPGQRALDVGTGTGTLALGLAERGLDVVGLDPSDALLGVARRRAVEAGFADGRDGRDGSDGRGDGSDGCRDGRSDGSDGRDDGRDGSPDPGGTVRFVQGTAEDTALEGAGFDLVTAGHCWWWFDPGRALAEARRVLRPHGRILLANFSYLPTPGSLAAATEALILAHNPAWAKAGECGVHEDQFRDLDAGGFSGVESFTYVEPVTFTHVAWRGRMQACSGVGAALPGPAAADFDRDLAALLARSYPEPVIVSHRVFVVTGVAP